jgi:hypothetical protein
MLGRDNAHRSGGTARTKWTGWEEGHFKCTCRKNCGRRFRLKRQLQLHLDKGCWLCGLNFSSRNDRSKHEARKHHIPDYIPRISRHKGGRCSGCDWDFLEKEDWERHANIPLCDRTTSAGRTGVRLTMIRTTGPGWPGGNRPLNMITASPPMRRVSP